MNRTQATFMTLGHPLPAFDLFVSRGRPLLEGLRVPELWATTLTTSLRLLEQLNREIDAWGGPASAGG